MSTPNYSDIYGTAGQLAGVDQFDKNYILSELRQLRESLQSIQKNHQMFLTQARNGYLDDLIGCYKIVAFESCQNREQSRIVALLYLVNEILSPSNRDTSVQEASSVRETQFKEQFKNAVSDLVNHLQKSTNLPDALKKSLDIFGVWRQKGIFEEEVIEVWIQKAKNSKSADQALAGDLPEGLPQVPTELLKLLENLQHKKNFEDKLNDANDLKKIEDLKEKQNKYQLLCLRNFKEVLQMLDQQHNKKVVELKLLIKKIDELDKLRDNYYAQTD